MRVLLLTVEQNIMSEEHPNYQTIVNLKEFKRRSTLWDCPNLSLLTIASYFPEHWMVDYVDLKYEELPDCRYDVAFIAVTTAQAVRAYEVADILRMKHTLVILGGAHPSVMYQEALSHADIVCIGESENYILQLVSDIELRETKPVYSNKAKVSLENCPLPRYDLAVKYPYQAIPIQITRGCPHACSFCASTAIYGTIRRCKDLDSIEKSFNLIASLWKYPLLFFTDDNLFIDDEFTRRLLGLMGKYSFRWYAFADISIAQRSCVLREMRKVGCQQLLVGFESLSERCLETINVSHWKQQQRSVYEEGVYQIQSERIGVVGSFILGLDGEGESAFVDIERFVMSTDMYATNITIATPFPGTRLFSSLMKENRILHYDWRHYNGFELTFKPERWEVEEFENMYRDLQIRINNPERIQKMMRYFRRCFLDRDTYGEIDGQ